MSKFKFQKKLESQTTGHRGLKIGIWKLCGYCLPHSVCRLGRTLLWGFLSIGYFTAPLIAAAQCYPVDKNSTRLCNPIQTTDIAQIIGFFLKTLVPLAGVLALLIFIIASIRFILSSGNAEKVQEGKDTAVWALLGTIVILGSYIALNFIFNVLTGTAKPGY